MLAVRAARMFDGIGPDLVRDPVVLVEDGRFVEVFAGGEPPGGAELVDLGDATLLPGLIDTHSHLAFNASGDVVGHLDGLSNEALLDEMRLAARATLASGVTTMRDLGDRDYLALRIREETAADPHAGPTVLAAGPPITTTRGHCWFLDEEADGIDAVRAAVRERAERGVDVVKVMASGGGLTPGSGLHLRQYDRPQLRAMVNEASRHGLPITAHAHATGSIADGEGGPPAGGRVSQRRRVSSASSTARSPSRTARTRTKSSSPTSRRRASRSRSPSASRPAGRPSRRHCASASRPCPRRSRPCMPPE